MRNVIFSPYGTCFSNSFHLRHRILGAPRKPGKQRSRKRQTVDLGEPLDHGARSGFQILGAIATPSIILSLAVTLRASTRAHYLRDSSRASFTFSSSREKSARPLFSKYTSFAPGILSAMILAFSGPQDNLILDFRYPLGFLLSSCFCTR
jgi:hypothetical protein